jgi:UDP-3-O-[3-hydroxymyristoyl] glucosamine N-acyltransferase
MSINVCTWKSIIYLRSDIMGVVYDFNAVDASFHFASCVTLLHLPYFIIKIHSVQPSLRAVKLGGKLPVINGAFVAPTATILGKVHVGSSSSIWYSAVIRGNTRIYPRRRVRAR